MKDLKGTKTEANLMTAFAGESQARNKYTYYASKAKKKFLLCGFVAQVVVFHETQLRPPPLLTASNAGMPKTSQSGIALLICSRACSSS